MFKDLLIILVLGAAVGSISAATISSLQSEIRGTEGGSITLMATVSDLSNSTLTWHIGSNEAANASITVVGNVTTVGKVMNLRANTVATFVASGRDVMTNLTLNSLTMTLNQSMIKLSDGPTESNDTLLIVVASKETTPASTTVAETTTTVEVTTTAEATTTEAATTTTKETSTITKEPVTTSTPTTAEETAEKSTTESRTGCDSFMGTASCLDVNCAATYVRTTMPYPGKNQTCDETYICSQYGTWNKTSEVCTHVCIEPGTWGTDCTDLCGMGCKLFDNKTRFCDVTNGRCLDNMGQAQASCDEGYKGTNCEEPICQDCNGGVCLRPNFCGNCPRHFEHGPTCRNIRLEGFLKGSLSSLAILAVIVILLTLTSNWHINRKIKEA